MNSDVQCKRVSLGRMRDIEIDADSHHFIVLSILNSWVANVAAPAASGVLLDFGCGAQPYRKVFEPFISRYIGADVASEAGIELDLQLHMGVPIPLPAGSVDTILSTQVLEHVFGFQDYLADCFKLLRPKGRLMISVPMHWRHHEVPHDYWRFTRYGLKMSLKQAGFSILDLRPCGGVYALLGQVYLDHLNSHANNTDNRAISRLINWFAMWLDKRKMDCDDTLGWMCIAEKISNIDCCKLRENGNGQ